jgi:hypothetical protein
VVLFQVITSGDNVQEIVTEEIVAEQVVPEEALPWEVSDACVRSALPEGRECGPRFGFVLSVCRENCILNATALSLRP